MSSHRQLWSEAAHHPPATWWGWLARRERLLALGVVGLCARGALALLSTGSNDVLIWKSHAQVILEQGLGWAYQHASEFNHPPLMGYWVALALKLAPHSDRLFSLLLKTPGLLAELGSALLLYRLGRRQGPHTLRGEWLFAGYAWCLASQLISGFHGNTDAVYALACLLVAERLDRSQWFWGGVAMAAALNVKLLPLVLLPAFALALPTPRAFLHFSGGLALGLVPFVPFLAGHAPAMYQRMVAYNSLASHWGLMALIDAARQSRLDALGAMAFDLLRAYGRYLVMLAAAAVGLAARRRGGWSFFEVGALGAGLFLVLTPGFGVQYLIFALPLLFAAAPAHAAQFGWWSGLFLAVNYSHFSVGGTPWRSNFSADFPPLAVLVGLLAWLSLGRACWAMARLGWRPSPASLVQAG